MNVTRILIIVALVLAILWLVGVHLHVGG